MKIRKTNSRNRETYTYKYLDGTQITIKPGEDSITEADIKRLHAMDDSEVYYNNKNLRSSRTEKEKNEIRKWQKKFTEDFKKQYGYESGKEILEYYTNEKFPRNYNLSLDYVVDDSDSDEKLNHVEQSSVQFEVSESFLKEEIRKELSYLTEMQFEVLWLNKVEKYTQTEIAIMFDTSIPNIYKHLKRAEKKLKKNKENFRWG